jgi:hypothetical protein
MAKNVSSCSHPLVSAVFKIDKCDSYSVINYVSFNVIMGIKMNKKL